MNKDNRKVTPRLDDYTGDLCEKAEGASRNDLKHSAM
jgi:hypothetical protein